MSYESNLRKLDSRYHQVYCSKLSLSVKCESMDSLFFLIFIQKIIIYKNNYVFTLNE